MESKSLWQSKTLWFNLLVAGSAFFPGAAKFVAENPQTVMIALAIVGSGLRLITNGKVAIQ